MRIGVVIIFFSLAWASLDAAETFWNTDKSKSFEGDFIKKEGNKFVLRSKDNRITRLSANQLAPESLELIARLQILYETKAIFEYHEDGFFLKGMPKEYSRRKVGSYLRNCTFLKKNRTFLKKLETANEEVQGWYEGATAYDLEWLGHTWVLFHKSKTPEFGLHLPASVDFGENETHALVKKVSSGFCALSGLEPQPVDLWFRGRYKREAVGQGTILRRFVKHPQPRSEKDPRIVWEGDEYYLKQRMIAIWTGPWGAVKEIKD